MTRHDIRRGLRRLRPRNGAMALGVCARVADFLDIPAWPVRLAVVVALVFHPVATVTLYGVAAVATARAATRRRLS